jgi:F0F1-type ATP synthase assembly protein I
MAAAYQGAVEAVVAMVICAVAGWWIDRRFGSGPWGLFVGMAVGFAALLLRLLRIKTPTIGRADPLPRPPERDAQDDDEHDRDGWTRVLTPGRDRDDEDSGGPPESQ